MPEGAVRRGETLLLGNGEGISKHLRQHENGQAIRPNDDDNVARRGDNIKDDPVILHT